MVAMIQTSREFEANQKVLSSTNQTLQKAVNELGKIFEDESMNISGLLGISRSG